MASNNPGQSTSPARSRVRLRRSTKKSPWDKWAVAFQGIAALAIPISLITVFVGVYQFKDQQSTSAAQALDQQRQTTLDNYLDDMSALVLSDNLSSPKAAAYVKAIAVARTDTAARNLDGARKGILVRFLWEAGLIKAPQPIVELYDVNLTGATFAGANLSGAELSTNDLSDANFYHAQVYGSDLSKTDLSGANLNTANLGCIPNENPDISGEVVRQQSIKDTGCASLNDANLSGAYLEKTVLIGADLRNANLSGAHLNGATYNVKTIYVEDSAGNAFPIDPTKWPKGFNPAASGLTCVDC